jgi:sulfate adenylyltransferase large subunit
MEKPTLKFVIVGHVDHGKSTLIGRLFYDTKSLPPDKIKEVEKVSKRLGKETKLAYLLDHLREEREQGVTIDTCQIFFKTPEREYVIIDAPGHVEFVKNMITGASQAEAAFLIVDAKQGVQEQTKRHAYILSMLGLNQVVVIINKMDLVDYKEEEYKKVRKQTDKFLKSIDIKADFFIPISALKGDNVADKSNNMDWYEGKTVLQSLNSFKGRLSQEEKPLILPVQDVYKIDDKRITVGRVEAGTLKKGKTVDILPEGQTTSIKSVEKFNEETDKACSGESVGITTEDPVFIKRGDIVAESGKQPHITDSFCANIFWMSKEPFNKENKITLKCATQTVICRVEKIHKRLDSSTLRVKEDKANKLENLEVGEVLIKTKKPIAVESFNDVQELGRFVLTEDGNTVAGGIVTEVR